MCKMMIQSIEQKATAIELGEKALALARENLTDLLAIKGEAKIKDDSVAFLCEAYLDEYYTLRQIKNAKPSEL